MTRKRETGLALAAAAVAAVLWLALRNSNHTETGQLTRIASIKGWQVGYEFESFASPYLWLSNHEIFHFSPSATPGGWNNASVFDTQTGITQPAPGLIYMGGGYILGASPDGQWVLWNTQTFSSSPPGMAATRRSDGKTIRWPFVQPNRGEGYWLPDSRRWIDVEGVLTGKKINGHPVSEFRLVVHDVNRPGTRSFAVPGNTGAADLLGVTPRDKIIFNDTPDEWGGPAGQSQPPLSLREVSLDSFPPTARAFQVAAPATPPGPGAKMSLSPQGDRLMWTGPSYRPTLIEGWINRLLHRSYNSRSLDVWICHLDGSVPEHIGTWKGSDMDGVTWNPDGKHISLTMANALYSISVP